MDRQLGGQDRVLEFAERLRFDIAKGAAPYFLSDRERQEIYSGALRSLRRLLPGEPEGTGRIVLLALHILLAREGAEDDLASAAASAAELAERHGRSSAGEMESSITGRPSRGLRRPSPRRRGNRRYPVITPPWTGIQYGRAAGAGHRRTRRATRGPAPQPWQTMSRGCRRAARLIRAQRRPEHPEAYSAARTLFAETLELLGRLDSPSAEVIRDVRAVKRPDDDRRAVRGRW